MFGALKFSQPAASCLGDETGPLFLSQLDD